MSAKHRRLAFTVVIGAMSIAYAFFVFLPMQSSIRELNRELSGKQQYVTEAKRQEAQMEQAGLKLDKARQYAEQWDSLAPDQSELALVFANISQHAQDAGTTTLNFEPQQHAKMQKLHRVPVELGSEGDFRQIFSLLALLEQLPQTIWINELRLLAPRENSENLTCELTLELFTLNHENSD